MFCTLYAFFWVIPRRLRNAFLIPSSFYTHLPAYEDGTECSETSAYKLQTPGNYPIESVERNLIFVKKNNSLIGHRLVFCPAQCSLAFTCHLHNRRSHCSAVKCTAVPQIRKCDFLSFKDSNFMKFYLSVLELHAEGRTGRMALL